MKLFRESADLGHGKARLNVGRMIEREIDTQAAQDSFQYYLLAAMENKIPAALFQVIQKHCSLTILSGWTRLSNW